MSVRHSVALVAGAAIAGALLLGLRQTGRQELVFLAVGQGDCTLATSQGRAVLIDVGSAFAGERIVVPELRRRGIRQIDLILLSHPDSDHIGGLAAVARRFKVAGIAAPLHFKGHPDLVAALRAASLEDRQIQWVAGPSDARLGQIEMHIDVPDWTPDLPDNDGSMVVRLASPRTAATLTGDAGFVQEFQMMKRGSWRADVLKLGHHGSRFSTGEGWLDHVRPQLAVASCGRDNAYGHPAPEVLEKCAARGIVVWRTDRQGHLTLKL